MISYRVASVSDLASICALGNEVNQIHYQAWPQIFAPAGAPDRDRDFWERGIGKPEAETFLAEKNASVIGFISVTLVHETSSLLQPMSFGRIGSICVAGEHRGKGIGRALMACAEEWAAVRGALDMRLHVWAFNQPAMDLYEELGYSVRSHFLGKPL